MITNQIKNYTILALFVLLLISGGLNLYQSSLRKNDRIAAELSEARNQTEIAGHRASAKSFADQANRSEAKRIRDSIQFSRKDSVHVVKIQRLTSKLRLIDTSKSTDKQLDSLINLLYGEQRR